MSQPLKRFDSVLLSQVRLGVVSVLVARGATTFSELRSLLGLTQGNLGSHLQGLEKAGYIETRKEFVERKPRTTAKLTALGRKSFLAHVARLDQIARGG